MHNLRHALSKYDDNPRTKCADALLNSLSLRTVVRSAGDCTTVVAKHERGWLDQKRFSPMVFGLNRTIVVAAVDGRLARRARSRLNTTEKLPAERRILRISSPP